MSSSVRLLLGVTIVGTIASTAIASDHADTPVLINAGRHDARLTDLFAFVHDGNLVLPVCLNPAIPAGLQFYQFPSDLTVKIFIDRDSPVDFSNASDVQTYGGTIVNPAGINEDIVFEIHFTPVGGMLVNMTGLTPEQQTHVRQFHGLRDDPFIRGPLIGHNVSAIVLELPLADVITTQSTILVWATSKVDGLGGDINDLDGRALRSQLGPNLALNDYHPRDHLAMTGLTPDVIIYDTDRPASFPNGRKLTDDVVDLVGVPAILASDAPFPSENDVPFLADFPYLAPPQGVAVPTVSAAGIVGLVVVATLLAIALRARFGHQSDIAC